MNIGVDVRSLLEKERSGVGEYTYQLLNAIFDIDPVRSPEQKNFSENFSASDKSDNTSNGITANFNCQIKQQTSNGVDKENQYYLFYNSWKKVGEDFLSEWKKYSNVHFCEFHWPNKLLNFCFKFLGWPKIDRLASLRGSASRRRRSNPTDSQIDEIVAPRKVGARNDKLDVFFIPNLNFIALSGGVKKIITVHDLSFEFFPRFFSWKRRMWHWFINPKKLIRGADKIIAVSENTKNDLRELYKVAPEKVSVIYSGVSGGADILDIDTIKKKYNLPDNFILFLGTLEPRKNIEGLIRAFEILKQSFKFSAEGGSAFGGQVSSFKLVIVGPCGWLYKKIMAQAEKSPAHESIKLIDYIAPEEKFVFYKLAKLFVYPSFYEGFGFPPLEAAAVGTPVIISTNSSLPEVMGEAALMVDPNNPAEMAKVMIEGLIDENLRAVLIEKGKKQAEKFSWHKCAEEVLTSFK